MTSCARETTLKHGTKRRATRTGRGVLASGDWDLWGRTETDQRRRLPAPPIQKRIADTSNLISLIQPEDCPLGGAPLAELIARRRSRLCYTDEPITLEELSFLLWSAQGVRLVLRDGSGRVTLQRRTVPSGAARHPFESYVVATRVDGIDSGLYRYVPLSHALLPIRTGVDLSEEVATAARGQQCVRASAAVFVWTAVPYRSEWRYGCMSSKPIAVALGHVSQNLYLAAESIDCGTCGIEMYDQAAMDELLGADGQEELTVHLAPVGRTVRRDVVRVAGDTLDRYVGRYDGDDGRSVNISRRENRLYYTLCGGVAFELVPVSETSFQFRGLESQVTFGADASGRVTHFVFSRGDCSKIRKRLDEA